MDDKKYLIQKNIFLKNDFKKLGISKHYQMRDVQEFINKLIAWYNVKFSDPYLKKILDKNIIEDKEILSIMNFETLQRNYTSFEDYLFSKNSNSQKLKFQKEIVLAAGWGLIYDKKSSPEYGYYRAKKLIEDFNKVYQLNLNTSSYQLVINRKYTPENEDIRDALLALKKDEEREKKEKTKRHQLARVRSFFRK